MEDDLDMLGLPDDCLLSDIGSLDFAAELGGTVPDLDFLDFQNGWDSRDPADQPLPSDDDPHQAAPAPVVTTGDGALSCSAISDHDYIARALPKSPSSSDSGHSSPGSRSPFNSSASSSECTPNPATADGCIDDLDDELFAALSAGSGDESPVCCGVGGTGAVLANGGIANDFCVDLDLDSPNDPAALESRDMHMFMLGTQQDVPLLLPFTVQDAKTMSATVSMPSYPELRLTDEEKELLNKEGVVLPTNMPLTKSEERVLRSIRRRIRNKQSARNSRQKKQNYMDNLEERVKMCTDEKMELVKKVTSLEKQNAFLISQLRRLQNAIRIDSGKPARTTTCVLVLVLSFALFIAPNLSPFRMPWGSTGAKSPPMAGRSRSLLEVDEAEQQSSQLADSLLELRAYVEDTVGRFSRSTSKALSSSADWTLSAGQGDGSDDAATVTANNQSFLEPARDDTLSERAELVGSTSPPSGDDVHRSLVVAGVSQDASDVRHDDF